MLDLAEFGLELIAPLASAVTSVVGTSLAAVLGIAGVDVGADLGRQAGLDMLNGRDEEAQRQAGKETLVRGRCLVYPQQCPAHHSRDVRL